MSVAFSKDRSGVFNTPFATNISDTLWVTSRARILNFVPSVLDPTVLKPPSICPPVRAPNPGGSRSSSGSGRGWQEKSNHDAQLTHSSGKDKGAKAAERAALIDLAEATHVQGWAHRSRWLFPEHDVCDWELVGCNAEGHVKLLTLDFNNLDGTLPDSLANLTFLQDLDLEGNSLHGPIPASLGRLNSSLLQLGLGNNRLSGPVPAELCALEVVRTGAACDMSGNHFECPLPLCLGSGSSSQCQLTCQH